MVILDLRREFGEGLIDKSAHFVEGIWRNAVCEDVVGCVEAEGFFDFCVGSEEDVGVGCEEEQAVESQAHSGELEHWLKADLKSAHMRYVFPTYPLEPPSESAARSATYPGQETTAIMRRPPVLRASLPISLLTLLISTSFAVASQSPGNSSWSHGRVMSSYELSVRLLVFYVLNLRT
jgi:hypothetical protein